MLIYSHNAAISAYLLTSSTNHTVVASSAKLLRTSASLIEYLSMYVPTTNTNSILLTINSISMTSFVIRFPYILLYIFYIFHRSLEDL